jgi:hypothetical protein
MTERGLSDVRTAIFMINPASVFAFARGTAPATTGPLGGT